MGNSRSYNPAGGFYTHEYHPVGDTIYYDGLVGKIIVSNDIRKNGLPFYSDKSDFYVGISAKTGEVIQVRLFDHRHPSIDFDWGHIHNNKAAGDKTRFAKGTLHVHTYENDVRNEIARFVNNDEIKRFGELFKSLNPSVKFRP